MGTVSCFAIEGVKCWFFSQDHKPPHFHARRRGQWYVKIWFLKEEKAMLEEIGHQKGRISSHDRRALCELAATHRDELLKEWEQKVCHDD